MRDRSQLYGLNLQEELGIREVNGEFRGRSAVHLDAFAWVKRDSYLPHGSQGLKAVTKAKLGFDPIEINAEDMLRFAVEDPFYMASYSVSDAVSTYYLYMKYVHLFIYSLCTVLPLNAEDVLRKGSGTLCEMLLMVEAFRNGIVYPNKQIESPLRFYEGHLLESDSYIGGTVECLESGVYRNDLPADFALDASAFEELIAAVDQMLTFSIEMENGVRPAYPLFLLAASPRRRQLRLRSPADRLSAGAASRPPFAPRNARHLPPGRRRDVPQHHPLQPAAALRGHVSRALRELPLPRGGGQLRARDELALAGGVFPAQTAGVRSPAEPVPGGPAAERGAVSRGTEAAREGVLPHGVREAEGDEGGDAGGVDLPAGASVLCEYDQGVPRSTL